MKATRLCTPNYI